MLGHHVVFLRVSYKLMPLTQVKATISASHNLVGIVHIPDECVHPVLVVGGGPRRPKVRQSGCGVEEVRVVEVLLEGCGKICGRDTESKGAIGRRAPRLGKVDMCSGSVGGHSDGISNKHVSVLEFYPPTSTHRLGAGVEVGRTSRKTTNY